MIQVRNYKQRDAASIVRLFYDTIHSINRRDYSAEQVNAWAPTIPDPTIWHRQEYLSCRARRRASGLCRDGTLRSSRHDLLPVRRRRKRCRTALVPSPRSQSHRNWSFIHIRGRQYHRAAFFRSMWLLRNSAKYGGSTRNLVNKCQDVKSTHLSLHS
jgi:hypothetical protein